MAETRYTQWHCTGTAGMAYGDFSMPPEPAYVQWRALGVSTRAYGEFTRTVDALAADDLTLGAVTVGSPAFGKSRYTQLRHGPLPGPVYGSFADKPSSFNALFATNLTSQAAVLGSPQVWLAPPELATQEPTVGAPALTQLHSLVATTLASQAVTVGSPILAGEGELIADEPVIGNASVPSVQLVQQHSWAPATLLTGAVSYGTASVAVSSNFTASTFETGAVDVPEAYLNPPQAPVSYFYLMSAV